MSKEIAKTEDRTSQEIGEAVEAALVMGDLSRLSSEQRVSYYRNVCDSVGLNPATSPFAYILLNGKLSLYAKKDCTEQLRKLHGVSIRIISKEKTEDLLLTTVQARDSSGREDESTGAVSLAGLRGEALANAYMKGETKAKRRVTLSICGLGFLDESEIESLSPGIAQVVSEDWTPNPAIEKLRVTLESAPKVPDPVRRETATTVEPLENPWLFQITRNRTTKPLCQVDSRFTNNARAKFERTEITEEEFVNIEAALNSPHLKEEALRELELIRIKREVDATLEEKIAEAANAAD